MSKIKNQISCERCDRIASIKLQSKRWVCSKCYAELPLAPTKEGNNDKYEYVLDDMATGLDPKRRAKVNWSIVSGDWPKMHRT